MLRNGTTARLLWAALVAAVAVLGTHARATGHASVAAANNKMLLTPGRPGKVRSQPRTLGWAAAGSVGADANQGVNQDVNGSAADGATGIRGGDDAGPPPQIRNGECARARVGAQASCVRRQRCTRAARGFAPRWAVCTGCAQPATRTARARAPPRFAPAGCRAWAV